MCENLWRTPLFLKNFEVVGFFLSSPITGVHTTKLLFAKSIRIFSFNTVIGSTRKLVAPFRGDIAILKKIVCSIIFISKVKTLSGSKL